MQWRPFDMMVHVASPSHTARKIGGDDRFLSITKTRVVVDKHAKCGRAVENSRSFTHCPIHTHHSSHREFLKEKSFQSLNSSNIDCSRRSNGNLDMLVSAKIMKTKPCGRICYHLQPHAHSSTNYMATLHRNLTKLLQWTAREPSHWDTRYNKFSRFRTSIRLHGWRLGCAIPPMPSDRC